MKLILIPAGLALIALAGCGSQNTTLEAGALSSATAALTTYTSTGSYGDAALAAAEAAFAAYKATKNPSPDVIAKANTLLAAAQSACEAAQANPTDALKAAEQAAIASFATYLLTAAPGNGVTPASA